MNIRKILYDNRWTLGFYEEDLANVEKDINYHIHWMKNPYKNRWFADPFILDVTDKEIIVLVEEFYDPIQRGRISKLVIDRQSYKLVSVETVLELSSHLSFPAIIRKNGEVYIYPENSAGTGLDIYEYDLSSNKCEKIRNITDLQLTDAIISNLFGKEYIFSTRFPQQNGNLLDVYEKQSNNCVKIQDISFESNIARNAGDWFKVNGKIYRPAQDCSKRYGGAIVIQRVWMENENFYFEDIKRLEYSYKSYNIGCHTYNHYKGVSVIDVNGYRRPFLAKLGMFSAKIRHKIWKM